MTLLGGFAAWREIFVFVIFVVFVVQPFFLAANAV